MRNNNFINFNPFDLRQHVENTKRTLENLKDGDNCNISKDYFQTYRSYLKKCHLFLKLIHYKYEYSNESNSIESLIYKIQKKYYEFRMVTFYYNPKSILKILNDILIFNETDIDISLVDQIKNECIFPDSIYCIYKNIKDTLIFDCKPDCSLIDFYKCGEIIWYFINEMTAITSVKDIGEIELHFINKREDYMNNFIDEYYSLLSNISWLYHSIIVFIHDRKYDANVDLKSMLIHISKIQSEMEEALSIYDRLKMDLISGNILLDLISVTPSFLQMRSCITIKISNLDIIIEDFCNWVVKNLDYSIIATNKVEFNKKINVMLTSTLGLKESKPL